jgi:hypothetical protein
MAKEAAHVDVEQALEKLAAQPLTHSADTHRASGESRELWRVISADGSTRLFETTPAAQATANRPPKASHAANLISAQSPKLASTSKPRGRLVTPLRRETGHDEKVTLAELFEAAAARRPLAVVPAPRPESKVSEEPTPARGRGRLAADSPCVATVLSTGDLPATDGKSAAPHSTTAEPPLDADLKQTVDAWPSLSLGIRAAIVAMVRAASAERTAAS